MIPFKTVGYAKRESLLGKLFSLLCVMTWGIVSVLLGISVVVFILTSKC